MQEEVSCIKIINMLKVTGMIFVIIASTYLGILKGEEARERVKELRELKQILCQIQKEIQSFPIPIAEIFADIEKRTLPVYQPWLKDLKRKCEERENGTFFEIWERSIHWLKGTKLTKDELDGLLHLGKNIQMHESIGLFISGLEHQIHLSEKEYEIKKKLYRSMGVMAGIFLVVLLL